jgi:ABC-2 type transport system permease protein/oleandomycin transport system permease protein
LLLAVAFGSPNTGVGLAEDLTTGMLDRFRSLPMTRAAPLAGRILADAIRNLAVVLVMVAVGTLIGFRFHAGFPAALAAIALPVAVGCVLSWFAALVGLATGDAETAGAAALLPIIPLAFTSSAFVPIDTMPGPLQAWADFNPITHIVDADRALILGGTTAVPLLEALAWLTVLSALIVPLAVRRYHRASQ